MFSFEGCTCSLENQNQFKSFIESQKNFKKIERSRQVKNSDKVIVNFESSQLHEVSDENVTRDCESPSVEKQTDIASNSKKTVSGDEDEGSPNRKQLLNWFDEQIEKLNKVVELS